MMQTTTATTATVEAASNMGRFYPDRECLTRGIRKGVVAPMAVSGRLGHEQMFAYVARSRNVHTFGPTTEKGETV
jgi:hypothetical protein